MSCFLIRGHKAFALSRLTFFRSCPHSGGATTAAFNDSATPCADCICGLMVCVPSCPASQMLSWDTTPISGAENVLAPYQGSPWDNIDAMLDMAGFKVGDRVLDLGAGDARVMIRAKQRGASLVEGWELSKDVYNVGLQHINAAFDGRYDSSDEFRYFHGDARGSKPFEFDIVTMFLLPYGLNVLRPWLQRSHLKRAMENQEAGKSTRLVSQGWPLFPELGPDNEPGGSLQLQTRKAMKYSGAQIFVYS